MTSSNVGVFLKRILTSNSLSFALRYLLGAMILLSAVLKIVDIEANSVYVVYNYYILPVQPVNVARFVGLVIPFVELVIGLGLILGVLTRFAAIGWIVLSLAYLLVKMHLIFVQGRIVPCGCFQALIPNLLVTQSIWIDVAGILCCLQILAADRKSKSGALPRHTNSL